MFESDKHITFSFGLAGASTGLYDLSRAMDGTDYAHIIVVKHRDKEEYQGKYPKYCILNTLYFTMNFTGFASVLANAIFQNTFLRRVFW